MGRFWNKISVAEREATARAKYFDMSPEDREWETRKATQFLMPRKHWPREVGNHFLGAGIIGGASAFGLTAVLNRKVGDSTGAHANNEKRPGIDTTH